jgi:hypothetical protein
MSNGPQTPARREEHASDDQPRPHRQLTRAEVEEQLRRRRESIDGHLDGLRQDLKAGGQEAQQGVEHLVQRYPLAVLGGLGLAGAAVGYWLVRWRRKRREAATSRTWMDEYHDAVREEVRAAARRGEDPGEAAGRILEGHRPLVVRNDAQGGGSKGLLRTVLDLAGRTLVSVAVKYAVDAASGQVLSPRDARGGEGAGDAAAPIASAVSSSEEGA